MTAEGGRPLPGAGRLATAPRHRGARAALPSGPLAIVLGATGLAVVLRAYQLLRPGFLFGVTEYDDGVYFGAAVRLLNGALPYRDFAFVQPPGIVLLMSPVALLAKATSTSAGLAVARILTAAASAAAVPLVGRLLRGRGGLALTLGCGLLAVYPAGINAAHTLLLEPWLVLLVLLGLLAIFDGDAVTDRSGRLVAAGIAFGLALAIKLWVVIPAGVVLLVCARACPPRATLRMAVAIVLAFAAAVGPFVLLAPHAFVRDVVVAQLARTDFGRLPMLDRLTSLTGLSVFAPVAGTVVALACLAYAVAVLAGPARAALPGGRADGAGARVRRGPTPLEAAVLATLALLLLAFLLPADYYLHYGWFFGPFLALALGSGIGRGPGPRVQGAGRGGRRPFRVAIAGLVAVGFLITAGMEMHQLDALRGAAPASAARRAIPPGACVLTDLVSLTIVSDRFTADRPGCSPMIDGLGTDLALSRGRNGANGAARTLAVRATWLGAFGHADYVWLQCAPSAPPQCGTGRRIPWTRALRAYFAHRFRAVTGPGSPVNLWRRRPG